MRSKNSSRQRLRSPTRISPLKRRPRLRGTPKTASLRQTKPRVRHRNNRRPPVNNRPPEPRRLRRASAGWEERQRRWRHRSRPARRAPQRQPRPPAGQLRPPRSSPMRSTLPRQPKPGWVRLRQPKRAWVALPRRPRGPRQAMPRPGPGWVLELVRGLLRLLVSRLPPQLPPVRPQLPGPGPLRRREQEQPPRSVRRARPVPLARLMPGRLRSSAPRG